MSTGLAFAIGAALGLLPHLFTLVGLIHLHRWSRWISICLHKVMRGEGSVQVDGQRRTCRTCGKEQVRES